MNDYDFIAVIKRNGFTLSEVARRLGTSHANIAQNLRKNPRIGTLEKIAEVIGCDVTDFFMSTDDDLNIHISCPGCGTPINIKTTITFD